MVPPLPIRTDPEGSPGGAAVLSPALPSSGDAARPKGEAISAALGLPAAADIDELPPAAACGWLPLPRLGVAGVAGMAAPTGPPLVCGRSSEASCVFRRPSSAYMSGNFGREGMSSDQQRCIRDMYASRIGRSFSFSSFAFSKKSSGGRRWSCTTAKKTWPTVKLAKGICIMQNKNSLSRRLPAVAGIHT